LPEFLSLSYCRCMNDMTLTRIETRLRRGERQNRVLIALLCAAVGLAFVGATRRGASVISADEFRAHRFSVIDPNGAVASRWYSDEPGSYHGP
jgi:hypothetical protein